MGLFTKDPVGRVTLDLLGRLPFAVTLYRLDAPSDAASLRLLYGNEASERFTGLSVEAEVGKRLVDIAPGVRASGLLDQYAEAVRTGEAASIGPIDYSDQRIEGGTFQINAIPLPDRCLGVVFEEVSTRQEIRALQETQSELAFEEARYRSLIEATAAIVWSTPPSGEFEGDQPRWRAFTGQTPDELLGWGWLDAVHPDDRDATVAAWTAAVETRTRYEVVHRLRRADGVYRHMSVRAVPFEEGATAEWIGVHTDVEDQWVASAALAASEARFQSLFDALSDVLLVYPVGPDGPGSFVAVNEAAVRLYGYTREELAERTVEDLVVAGSVDIPDALAELRQRRQATFRSTHRTREGKRVPMATVARLIEFDGQLCVVSVCRDDTERRAFERELSRSNLGLERTVGERTAQAESFASALRLLHTLTTLEDTSPRAMYEAYLTAGVEMFGLPIGIISSTPTDPETGEVLYRIESVVAPDPSIEAGLTMPLREAFCDAVVAREDTVTYADAAADETGSTNPACVGRGLRAFIGTPIWLDDELFGTLNFVSPEPRQGGFSQFETELIEVMAEGIARQIRVERAEKKQADALSWYQTVVETVGEGLVVVDVDGRVVQSNPAARETLGLDDDGNGVAGRPVRRAGWRVLQADGGDLPDAAYPEHVARTERQAVRGHLQGLARPDGTVRWYSVNATPVAPEGEDVEVVVLTFTDVTELRATNDALSHLSADTARATHVGGWHWEPDGGRMEWTPELYRILGLDAAAVHPSLDAYLAPIPEDDREAVREAIGMAVRRGGAFSIEHPIVRPDGSVRQLIGRGEMELAEAGRVATLRGTVQDVTTSVAAS